ncbi:MAG: tRNA-dihydrouridine synthase [Treponema sp.]|nr:tRNA-dihydrouridine synthase [Treponema sp.]
MLYHPVTIGSLELPGNLFLAPAAGYTDRAFRSLCAEAGADLTFTELVSAEALTRRPELYGLPGLPGLSPAARPGSPPRADSACLVRRGPAEKRYGVQLFGAEPDTLGRACALLKPLKPDVVDLNAGCPVPKVVKSGAGSALMRDPPRLGRAVEALVRSSRESLGNVPVTVKIRAGWDAASRNYAECARIAVEAGAAMVSLHPRTRAQGYGGTSDWSLIADAAGRLSVPVCGSGDLYTPGDARRMLEETGCAAVMFARGAMGNPFIFTLTKALLGAPGLSPPEDPEPACLQAARLRAGLRHLEMLAEDLGETRACLEMRRHFCAYTKGVLGRPGMPGGAALRGKIIHAGTIAEYREILSYYKTV